MKEYTHKFVVTTSFRLWTIYSLFLMMCSAVALPGMAQSVISLDTSFNGIGYHSINLVKSSYASQNGDNILVNTADNKYIVRGWVNPYGAYLKYDRNGKPDNSFNKTGALIQPGSEPYVKNFFFDKNGNMINATATPDLVQKMGFMRTLPSGVPDSSFGVNGISYVANSSSSQGYFLPLAGDKYLVASNYWNVDTVGLKLQKFKSYSSLDSSFGTNGVVTIKFDYYYLYVRDVQVDADGKIIVAGAKSSIPIFAYDYDAIIMRFLPNGQLDQSFGTGGLVIPFLKTSEYENYYRCMVLPDKKILVCGTLDGQGLVERYLDNGKLDSTYGVLGHTFIPDIGELYNMQRQRDNKIILAGYNGYSIARITADGARDRDFGSNGIFRTPGITDGFPYGSLLENDTSFLITGNAFESSQSNNITTARYKIQFQPFVTGVASKYCFGDNGAGTIINMPAADTVVSVLLDNTTLTVSANGDFAFSSGSVGAHTLEVKFSKNSRVWKEVIRFNTNAALPVDITTPPQSICENGGSFLINANSAVYWLGINQVTKAASSGVLLKPAGLTGPQQIIAVKENGGCAATRDTVIINVIRLNPAITITGDVLSTPAQPGASYAWFLNGTLITGANTNQHTPVKNGDYTVRETVGSCSKTTSPVTITSIPVPLFTPELVNLKTVYCSNAIQQKCKLLNPPVYPATVNIALDGSGLSYYSLDSSISFNVGNAGSHTITIVYKHVDTKQKDFTYLVNQAPAKGTAPTQTGNKLSVPYTADSYQWYLNGNIIAGAVARDFMITQSGMYSYTYTINNCISPVSASLNAAITAIIDPVTNQLVYVSPNPATSCFYINGLSVNFKYQVLIYDLKGVLIKAEIIQGQSPSKIYLNELAKGLYFVTLENVTKKIVMGTQKLLIQ